MKRRIIKRIVTTGGILFLSLVLSLTLNAQKIKKTVFVIVDGIPADVIEKLSLPNLTAISKVGGFTKAYAGGKKGTYSETPTISAVGYNSVLTGTWVNKHNVWDNDIAAPNYHYPTIFRLLKTFAPEKKTAIFSTWIDNRTKLVGDRLEATGNIAVDEHYDGLELDTVQFPHDKKSLYLSKIDSAVSARAAETILSKAPDLTWLYLEFTDDMGHAHGDSPEYYEAIKNADKRIGWVWKAVQERMAKQNEDWLFIVTTDHGRDPKTGRGHGGQSDREKSAWIVTNAKDLNAEFKAPLASQVDIMPTIARFMAIPVDTAVAREVDGIPFTGKISFVNPSASHEGDKLVLHWDVADAAGKMKIWITNSNNVKTGGVDAYTLLGEVNVKEGKAAFPLKESNQGLIKVVFEAPYNMANQWAGK